jgi:murein DD-endopeptidase MepM/ murein hydrolase activator NlpD
MNRVYSPQREVVDEPKKTGRGRKLLWVVAYILMAFSVSKGFFWFKETLFQKKVQKIVIAEKESESATVPEKYTNVISYTVSAGDIPADIFSAQGKFDANDMTAILSAAKDVYDLTNIKLGKNLRFYFEKEARATRVEYDRDTERVIIIERTGDNFTAREEKIDYAVSQEIAQGTIDNFFYADALEAGLSESTVLEVGDIFSFDIDFTTEIQTGDTFAFIYEKRERNGEKAPDGKILAGKFVNAGTAYYAYYFDNNGNGGYYDADGRVLERQFLKAPLSYRRISSGFTGARMHPITRKVSAHYQIDYAAPSGTPVVASARGTVTSAGWSGGWGNMVRLEHDNGYTTHYGHLSAFAKGLRAGARVDQGQLVGYVGSTGWSTGPHLDYGIKLNGTPVNPLKLDMPKGAPLTEEKMQKFEELKKQYADLLK